MEGLKVDFVAGGMQLKTDEKVEGALATVQNVLVNVGTTKGSDRIFPSRGTNLLKRMVTSGVQSYTDLMHTANFAALDTLFFVRANEELTTDDSPEQVDLSVKALVQSLVELDVRVITVDGREFGVYNEFLDFLL